MVATARVEEVIGVEERSRRVAGLDGGGGAIARTSVAASWVADGFNQLVSVGRVRRILGLLLLRAARRLGVAGIETAVCGSAVRFDDGMRAWTRDEVGQKWSLSASGCSKKGATPDEQPQEQCCHFPTLRLWNNTLAGYSLPCLPAVGTAYR